jgi:hypothetical protein
VLEAFPVGASWIVDVNVGVDEAWEQDQLPGVDRANTGRMAAVPGNLDDPAVAYEDRRRPNAVW